MESQEDPSAGCSLSQPPRLDAYLGALTLSGEVEDNDDEEEEEELGEAAAALQRWASRLDQQRLSRQSSEAATASRLHVCDEEEEEEEEDDDEVRQHRRRAVSLPANPSQAAASLFHPFPGGGAGVEGCCKCKKRVQFADALGLSLASVRHFSASEEPRVPAAVLSRLRSFPACQRDLDELLLMGGGDATMLTPPPPPAFLEPDFLVPGGEELEARLRRDRVCLEAVSAQHFDVRGRVRILPLRGDPGEEEKEDESSAEVSVRYTFNEWLSYLDAPADREEEELLAGASRFRFTLCAPPCLDPGARLYFAVCYRAAPGREFWDNNEGRNYALQYLPPGHLSAASSPFPAEEMH